MLRYFGGRLLQALPVMVLASIVVFSLLRLLPGDPAQVLAGDNASPQIVDAVRHEFGLDQPLPVQYWTWLTHVVRGDLGNSVRTRAPVVEAIQARVPASLELAAAAILLTLLLAIPLGALAAVRAGDRLDWGISLFNGLSLAVPNFWLGILAIMLFALVLHMLPAGGFVELTSDPLGSLRTLALPALTLALPAAGGLARQVRSSMLEVLNEDYVRTARAKGLKESAVVVRHALRNALVPVVTLLALQVGRLLGGAVVVETVFSWPGVGRLIIDSISYRDYAVVQGTLLLFVLAFMLVNLLADLSYAVLDPHIRLSGGPNRA